MKPQHDVTKLPKWAQELIGTLQGTAESWQQNFEASAGVVTNLENQLDKKKSLERIADLDRRILSQVNKALGDAITAELTGYQKPLSKIVERVISAHDKEVYDLVNDEFANLLNADEFRAALKTALNAKLARVLIQRMGGELEAQVNELKRNPQTNALITLAVTGVVARLIEGEQS